ncbi:hypothetical protein [Paenibacillus woosongensis]|uniref:hypothetical protein n=1 Tax=Paenibacillus woosongensis TaxID=307580 RepID=UPI0018C2BCA6|nr:hypothetical protein [Paenibacillus woosongensis]
MERFSPFGYVLLLAHPGCLETRCGELLLSSAPEVVRATGPLAALTGPLYDSAPALEWTAAFGGSLWGYVLCGAVPCGDSLGLVRGMWGVLR